MLHGWPAHAKLLGPLQALWATEGLQTDALSVENGAIVSAAARYPLLIDPQLQGLRWIASRESANGLVIVQQGQPKYIDQVWVSVRIAQAWQRHPPACNLSAVIRFQLILSKQCAANQVIKCIENGLPLLIENLPEDIEAVLDPVISKRTFRRGNATLIRLGDAEVQVHSKFRCRLQMKGCAHQRAHHKKIA